MSLAHLAPRADLPIIAGLAHPPRSAPGNKQFLANGEQNNSQQKRHEMIELAAMQIGHVPGQVASPVQRRSATGAKRLQQKRTPSFPVVLGDKVGMAEQ